MVFYFRCFFGNILILLMYVAHGVNHAVDIAGNSFVL